ncbi:glycosyltransferase [Vibrio sp. DW001]|uniref:glycosyltransferase family 2 protein n=1 Tax=Vibrio sp. DW001 TaxID=2912315 RepID=UPI0023AE8F11|nr:glycosyltransferase [Vibrio sp. DW001]WED26883.1 glycosyltransferase [Vibrio sp. DW001]
MISIIMPSLDPDVIKITSTLESIFINHGDFELILVLQSTPAEKIKTIQNLFSEEKKLRIVINDEVGISAARNKGIKVSLGSWILLLDDDVYIKADTIKKLVGNLDKNVLMYYGNAKVYDTEEYYVKHFVRDKDLDIWNYNRVCSIALIINKNVFETFGYFDERLGSGTYFGSSEESDLILRVLLNEIRIVYMECYNVYHERAMHSLPKVERYARGSGALYSKFFDCGNYKLYLKFILDLVLRVIFLFTFRRKRYVFFKGFLSGLFKF